MVEGEEQGAWCLCQHNLANSGLTCFLSKTRLSRVSSTTSPSILFHNVWANTSICNEFVKRLSSISVYFMFLVL